MQVSLCVHLFLYSRVYRKPEAVVPFSGYSQTTVSSLWCLTASSEMTILASMNKTYPGGKAADGVYQTIINQIPPHETYIEPFLGSGAILRLKAPAKKSIALDLDPDVVYNFSMEIPGLRILREDALYFLSNFPFKGGEFIYLDPPYLFSTRRSKRRLYKFELGEEAKHRKLLDILKSLNVPVALSGYWSELYVKELSEWRSISFKAPTHKGSATEWLWMNYPKPERLHDYRYIGATYQKRQAIKRKSERWVRRFKALPVLERERILQDIETALKHS